MARRRGNGPVSTGASGGGNAATGGRGAAPRPPRQQGVGSSGAGPGGRQGIIDSLMNQQGMTREEATRFAGQVGWNSWDEYARWSNTWGQIDWTRNQGPNGQRVPHIDMPQATPPGGNGDPPPADPTDPMSIGNRQSVYDKVMQFFANLGLPGQEMSDFVKSQVIDNKQDWEIIPAMRQQTWYAQYFPKMNELIAKDGTFNEQKYLTQYAAYKEALRGLPDGFYDSRADASDFMLNEVSPLEVERRALFARQEIADGVDPEMKKALKDYYGISDGALAAHLLDPKRAQSVIDKELRAASYQRYVLESGRSLTQAEAERIANSNGAARWSTDSSGTTSDAYTSWQNDIQTQVGNADLRDRQDSFLSSLEGDRSYSFIDSLDAELGDQRKKLASEQRAQREQARFSGSSGIGRSSLSNKRGY